MTIGTLALLVATCAPAWAQIASWKSVAPQGFTGLVGGIDFTSRDTGYAVASSSDIDTKVGSILKSTDNGEHWTIRTFDGVGLYDVKFADARKGCAVGYNSAANTALMYTTADAGATWTPHEYPASTVLASIQFVDNNLGYAVGGKALMLKTTNGGGTWSTVASGQSDGIDFTKVFFVNATTGYMIGSVHLRDWPNLIFKTTDGGAHWATIVDNGTDTDTKPTYSSMFFLNADSGFVTGREGSTKTIYGTTNGGQSWTKVFSAPAAGNLLSMGGIQFLNSNVGYASGDEGTIARTTNGGQTWRRETSGVNTALPAIEFLDENTGLVGGLFGSLIKRSIPLLPTAVTDSTELDFGTVDAGTKQLTLSLSAANELGVRIDSAYIQNLPGKTTGFALVDPHGPFPITVSQGAPRTITVSFTPIAGGATDQRASLVLKTNDPANTFLTISLFAQQGSVATPTALLGTSALDFGNVQTGQGADRSFTLGAANAAGLRIDSIRIVDQTAAHPFQIIAPTTPTPINIAMDAPLTFTIRFAPGPAEITAGSHLEIVTNDPSNSKLTVALMGHGVSTQTSVPAQWHTSMRMTVRALPNPMGHGGTVMLTLPAAGDVSVVLYDIYGGRVADLFNGHCTGGELAVPLPAEGLANGIYYCIASAGGTDAYCEITIAR